MVGMGTLEGAAPARDLQAASRETKTLGLGLGPIKDICQKLIRIRDINLCQPPTSHLGLAHTQIRGMTSVHHIRDLGHRLQFRGMALDRRIKGTSHSQQIPDINRDRGVVVRGGNLLTMSSVIIVNARDTTPKGAPITQDAGKVVVRTRQDSMGRTLLN